MEDAITEHREDEILGGVYFQCPLVIILSLVMFTEFVDESVELLDLHCRPEIKLMAAPQLVVVVV